MKIEIEGEFRRDAHGDVYFGDKYVLRRDGTPRNELPQELVDAGIAWAESHAYTPPKPVKVVVMASFTYDDEDGSIFANGKRILDKFGEPCFAGRDFPELLEAAIRQMEAKSE